MYLDPSVPGLWPARWCSFDAYLGLSVSPVTTRAFPNTKLEDAFVGLHLVPSGRSKARSSVSLYQTFMKDQRAILELKVRSTEH
jgi:hypothetical protein